MKKFFYLSCITISSLHAMVNGPLDKLSRELNETLSQMTIILTSQSIVIGQETIHVLPQQFKNLKDKKSENFSSYIAGLPEVPEGEEATIFLPPVIDPKIFNDLVNWQTTKSKIADDLIVPMIVSANALGMDRVLDFLSNTFAQRNKAALFADPLGWWHKMKKIVETLPNELQVKLSEQLVPNINMMFFEETKREIPTIKASAFFFQPGEFVNLSVSLKGIESFKVGMVYKNNGGFALTEIPNCLCSLRKQYYGRGSERGDIGWSPNGEFLFVNRRTIGQGSPVFHWNQNMRMWETVEKFSSIVGVGISWSPDNKYLVVYKNAFLMSFIYYDDVIIKQTDIQGDIQGLGWSSDSMYCALYSSTKLTIGELDKNGEFNIIFKKSIAIDNRINGLAWRPSSSMLVIGFSDGECQLWKKRENENEWYSAQTLKIASKAKAYLSEQNVKNFIKWSPSGRYLFTLVNSSSNEFSLWKEENDVWVSDKLTLGFTTQDIYIKNVYWSKKDKLALLVGPFLFEPSMTHLQVWQQEDSRWQSFIAPLTPFNLNISAGSQKVDYITDCDVLYKPDGSFRLLGTINESGAISLWNLGLLEERRYLTLEQAVNFVDLYNKMKRGQQVSLPEELNF